MKLKNLSVATALLLALSGCGSSGGNDNRPATPNNEIKNNQATQQQSELDRLKAQLAQAQSEKQSTEEKLKQSEQLSTQDLNKAKQDLAQAEQRLKEAQKVLQDEQTKTQQATEKAKENLAKEMAAKEKAVKELEAKLANDKILNRNEVLKFALQSGLPQGWANELADDLQNKSKAEVADEVLNAHKTITLRQLARNYGLNNQDARQFARENKNSTLDEAETLLESRRNEIQQKRQLLINEIFALAKEKGLPEWEAHNFAYGRNHTDKESAVEDLNNYVTEKAERETKINELIDLAKEKGLEDWEAQNFANQNIDNDKSSALETLNQLAAEKEKERLQARKEEQIRELAENYKNTYFPNVHHFNTWEFAQKNKDKSLEEAKTELEQYKTNREKITELAKILTELGYDIEQFIDQNTLVSLEEAQINLDKKVDEAITNLKGTRDKPLGFLTKQDHSIRNEPIIENDREVANKTVTTYADIYNQKYSVITGNYNKTVEPYTEIEYYYEEGDNKNSSPFRSREVSKTRTSETYTVEDGSYPGHTNGFKTPVDKFPSEGRATYTGVAFDAKKQGELSYTVDFAERKGSGKITGLDHIGDITLQEAEIYKSASHNSMRVKGNAIADAWVDEGGVTGEYAANFFGPNAEEITGKASLIQGMYKGSYDSETGYSFVSPDRYISDVTIKRINDSSQDGSLRGNNIDVGFGGTRGDI
ncbi:factor H binding protein domain-containing protein [Rodentibacter mrazii]|uniref:factor H binding protein domain-containing protein n=1 Tax=Rodentibacter mrazii TaxID=1908257 RepID=UPI001FC91886|nr:factor H binding protein domain-containing protein [Rodentibacter mrazii]